MLLAAAMTLSSIPMTVFADQNQSALGELVTLGSKTAAATDNAEVFDITVSVPGAESEAYNEVIMMVDASDSVKNKLATLKGALIELAEGVLNDTGNVRVTVMGFGVGPKLFGQFSNTDELRAAVNNMTQADLMQGRSATNCEAALQFLYDYVDSSENLNKAYIFFTSDGNANEDETVRDFTAWADPESGWYWNSRYPKQTMLNYFVGVQMDYVLSGGEFLPSVKTMFASESNAIENDPMFLEFQDKMEDVQELQEQQEKLEKQKADLEKDQEKLEGKIEKLEEDIEDLENTSAVTASGSVSTGTGSGASEDGGDAKAEAAIEKVLEKKEEQLMEAKEDLDEVLEKQDQVENELAEIEDALEAVSTVVDAYKSSLDDMYALLSANAEELFLYEQEMMADAQGIDIHACTVSQLEKAFNDYYLSLVGSRWYESFADPYYISFIDQRNFADYDMGYANSGNGARAAAVANELCELDKVEALKILAFQSACDPSKAWMNKDSNADNKVTHEKAEFIFNRSNTGYEGAVREVVNHIGRLATTPYNNVSVTDYMSKWVTLDPSTIEVRNKGVTICKYNAELNACEWLIDESERPTAKEPIIVETIDAADVTEGGSDVDYNTSSVVHRITWNITDDALLTSDNFTLHYKVTIDKEEAGFSYDNIYPTNGNTDVHYTDENGEEQEKPIEVPTVKLEDPTPTPDPNPNPNPETIIPDPSVPTAPSEGNDDDNDEPTVMTIEIEEEPVPLAAAPEMDVVEIFDAAVPLDAAPKTGAGRHVLPLIAAGAASLIAALYLFLVDKKRAIR